MSEAKEKEEYLICTDDTVIEMGIKTFAKALEEARNFEKAFLGLNVYVCKVICDASRV